MKVVSKLGVLAAVALLATFAVAASAQAVEINPPNTAIEGVANDPTLDYEGTEIVCDSGTANGTTGPDGSNVVNGVVLDFIEPCTVADILDAQVDCTGTVTLVAQADVAPGGTGTVNLDNGFRCDIVTDLCTVTVQGPQTTQDGNLILDEGADTLDADVGVQASRTGSELCGPPSGTGGFDALYALDTHITIDP